MAEHNVPSVVLPLEGWRQVLRRVRQLRVLHVQQNALIESLYETIDAMPDEGGNETGGLQR
jgi:hypothetical protein